MPAKHYDPRIFRIISILKKLDTGEKVSTRSLAEEFNVTIRTVQRDINLLLITGFPILSDGADRYSFIEDFSLSSGAISKEEASLLSLLGEIANSLGKEFEGPFRNILNKAISCRPDDPFYIKFPDVEKLKDKGFAGKIKRAITEQKKVELEYEKKDGSEKSYKVDPLKIALFEGFWYLLARFEGAVMYHKFALDRIREVKILNKKFKYPENLKIILDESTSIWSDAKRDIKAVLLISPDVAQYFKKKSYFPLQKILGKKKDGSLEIESTLSHPREAIDVVLKWLPHIKVVRPKSIRDEVKSLVEEYIRGL